MPTVSMRRFGVLAAVLATVLCPAVARAGIVATIYEGFTPAGDGTPFFDPSSTFITDDILFATNTGYNWHPDGLAAFGAQFVGSLSVAADGVYTFGLNSDDGSALYIDGSQVIDNGGAHGPQLIEGSVFLTAGLHPFVVNFFEDFGGESGVDLYLPDGVTYAAVPEPASLALAGVGAAAVAARARRRRV
ncbi:MAG: PEP-CTERM sorting domain-containing protein [Gemmataceae bacterium]|nr:PEP-CTERM sorting domain-containing protein [Gemmataceae bacterium]